MAYMFISMQFLCLVNEAPESDRAAVEGEAAEVEHVEETPIAEGKHHAYFYPIWLSN